jgi:excinuclease ABC subunit A
VSLGQPTNTLSGGETQRLKLSKELSKKKMKPTLYIFDEPSTGLHLSDLERLYQSFELLIEQGQGVMVIEHNTDFIRKADYIVDLGPDGGDGGGEIVFAGTPRNLKEKSTSALRIFL